MMAVVKVIEIIAESDKSWEDAAQQALKESSKTIRNIKSIYIKEFQVVVGENNRMTYRVDAKISFVVDEVHQ